MPDCLHLMGMQLLVWRRKPVFQFLQIFKILCMQTNAYMAFQKAPRHLLCPFNSHMGASTSNLWTSRSREESYLLQRETKQPFLKFVPVCHRKLATNRREVLTIQLLLHISAYIFVHQSEVSKTVLPVIPTCLKTWCKIRTSYGKPGS